MPEHYQYGVYLSAEQDASAKALQQRWGLLTVQAVLREALRRAAEAEAINA